ncbi:hypothetical protein BJ875DRAFT_266833 [Amylocarpus encephaloides]|uniref:Uncharacterized protein n=1 Tax=Amylocarpus encephaloides TaxID=45428 RepID=A0A9P7YLV9_9HELO|nr:hypothetical protein BJ875DRAFT_266833 [Amylocarpus encephaloides]
MVFLVCLLSIFDDVFVRGEVVKCVIAGLGKVAMGEFVSIFGTWNPGRLDSMGIANGIFWFAGTVRSCNAAVVFPRRKLLNVFLFSSFANRHSTPDLSYYHTDYV